MPGNRSTIVHLFVRGGGNIQVIFKSGESKSFVLPLVSSTKPTMKICTVHCPSGDLKVAPCALDA
jgi:hypothetical protein